MTIEHNPNARPDHLWVTITDGSSVPDWSMSVGVPEDGTPTGPTGASYSPKEGTIYERNFMVVGREVRFFSTDAAGNSCVLIGSLNAGVATRLNCNGETRTM